MLKKEVVLELTPGNLPTCREWIASESGQALTSGNVLKNLTPCINQNDDENRHMMNYSSNLAFVPQVPGHGSMHFSCLHALFGGQSVELIHSGLQAKYGSPKYSGIHWQAAALFLWLQSALDPHGVGLHGSTFSVARGGAI